MQEDIKKCIETLRSGGVILYPTDTIWGLGCDATNPDAVKKIYEIKKRVDSKAMLVLAQSFAMVERYVEEVPAMAYDLVEYSEKPITIIYENARGLAENLLGDNFSIGMRIPKDAFLEQLLLQFRKPIVSTSANISGEASPSVYGEITKEIRESADYVVIHRQSETIRKQASSIVSLRTNGEIKIIRP